MNKNLEIKINCKVVISPVYSNILPRVTMKGIDMYVEKYTRNIDQAKGIIFPRAMRKRNGVKVIGIWIIVVEKWLVLSIFSTTRGEGSLRR